jgi:hypothetical protein
MFKETANYVQLYITSSDCRISGLDRYTQDSLVLKIEPSAYRKWIISAPDTTYERFGRYPVISLKNGYFNYTVYADELVLKDTVQLKIEFRNNEVVLQYSSIPVIGYSVYPIEKWTKLPNNISDHEITETKRIIREEIGITGQETSVEKIQAIAKYLLARMRSRLGSPSDSIKSRSAYRQFDMVRNGNDSTDCGVYSDVFHLFANCAGVPTRRMGIIGVMDYITVSGHVINECYVKEQQRWAFVDLTSEKILVHNKKNLFMNTIELYQANHMKVQDALRTISIDSSGKIISKDYALTNASELEHLKTTASVYVIRPDIKENSGFIEEYLEFLKAENKYGTGYSNTIEANNDKHYLKVYLFRTLLIVFALWVFASVVKLIRFAKKR